MTRSNIRRAISLGSVVRSGRWPRRFDGHRDHGKQGKGKAVTLRTHRKG